LTVDGHDRVAVAEAVVAANADPRPSLISCKTHIGHGSPNKQDKAASHGSPLGDEEIALVKEGMGWDLPPFEVPEEVYSFFSAAMDRGRAAHALWNTRIQAAGPDVVSVWNAHWQPQPVSLEAPAYDAGSSQATRSVSGKVIQEAAEQRPDLMGGAADLASSTKTLIDASDDFTAASRIGRNLRFGVREHAMGAAANGLTLHGGLRGYTATFLTFSDYMRPAIRLAALMKTPSVFVFTHDSVFLGEDGPTHQPVEHVAALRVIPNLWVIRPGDPAEVAGAWEVAINRTDGPTALILTRQNVPVESAGIPGDVARGAYVVSEGSDVTLVATGSELWLARATAGLLDERGISARVVSMPCVEAFLDQSDEYRSNVVPADVPAVSIEAETTWGWDKIVGRNGLKIGIDTFGESAPDTALAEHFGFTPQAVADRVADHLAAV
jgi:transketolase